MKKLSVLFIMASLFLASCNSQEQHETNNDKAEVSETAITNEGIVADDGSAFMNKKEGDAFKPIDVYIFIEGSEGSPISKAKVAAKNESGDVSALTDKYGHASLTLEIGQKYKFYVSAEGYNSLNQEVDARDSLKFGLKKL
jgi:hypothetical protein